MRIDALLRASAIDQLEARILIAHALQWTRIELVTRSQDELSDDDIAAAMSVLQRRRDGEPIAYITGEREFFGLKLKVTPAVLIPRHETELLVEQAAQHLGAKSSVLEQMKLVMWISILLIYALILFALQAQAVSTSIKLIPPYDLHISQLVS